VVSDLRIVRLQRRVRRKIHVSGTALMYSTYISAEDDDLGLSIAVDGGGNAYVGGTTWSRYLPVVNAFQSMSRGSQEGFVAKLNPTGTSFVYASYLGGSRGTTDSLEGIDALVGIAIDGNGNAYVTGETLSRDFPVTANAVQKTLAGGPCDARGSPCSDAFMTKITAGGPGVVPAVNVTVTPTDLAPGGTFTVSWNGIPGPTNDDWLNVYKLGGLSDSTNRVASWRTTGAAAGTLQLTLPATVASGWYELRLLSPDPKNFGVPGVIARSAPINVGPHSDVLVTAVTNPPAIAALGTSFTVTDTTTNRGALPSKGSVTRFYLSLDRARNTGDRILTGTRSVGVLAPNVTSTGTTTLTIPTVTPVGTYVLLACADDTSTNVESNESNNCTASAGSVSVGASDLIPTYVSNPPVTAQVGTTFKVSDTTENRGKMASAASTTRLLPVPQSRLWNRRSTSRRGSHCADSCAQRCVDRCPHGDDPDSDTAGSYFLLACADDTKVNIESGETNNWHREHDWDKRRP
jgi:hypothetical protein